MARIPEIKERISEREWSYRDLGTAGFILFGAGIVASFVFKDERCLWAVPAGLILIGISTYKMEQEEQQTPLD